MNQNKVYLKRLFNCPPEQLFNFLTSPSLIAQWFGPQHLTVESVESELKTGGTYCIKMLKENEAVFSITGTYLAIQKPSLLQFSYEYLGLSGRPKSTVTFSISRIQNDQSELRMVQEFEAPTPDFETRTDAWKSMLEKIAVLTAH